MAAPARTDDVVNGGETVSGTNDITSSTNDALEHAAAPVVRSDDVVSDTTASGTDDADDAMDDAMDDIATDDGSASATESVVLDVVKRDSNSKRCPFCFAKKISIGCVVKACKKCCVSRNEDCASHARKNLTTKLLLAQSTTTERPKKPVLKREFKEPNFQYYEETVAIFCVRDFFASKKMSQGILNDQVRALRVRGTYEGQQQRKRKCVRDPALKARIAAVFATDAAPFSPRQLQATGE